MRRLLSSNSDRPRKRQKEAHQAGMASRSLYNNENNYAAAPTTETEALPAYGVSPHGNNTEQRVDREWFHTAEYHQRADSASQIQPSNQAVRPLQPLRTTALPFPTIFDSRLPTTWPGILSASDVQSRPSLPSISTLSGPFQPGMSTACPMVYGVAPAASDVNLGRLSKPHPPSPVSNTAESHPVPGGVHRPVPPMSAMLPRSSSNTVSTNVSEPSSVPSVWTPSAREAGNKSKGPYRRLSIHETAEAARIAMRSVDDCVYIFKYRYGREWKTSVYECASHESCKMEFRLNPFEEPSTGAMMLSLECRGSHSSIEVAKKQSGIHEAFKPEVDALIAGGAGPKKVLKILSQKYLKQPQMMQKLPLATQIRSRKSFKTSKECKIKTFAELCEWSSIRMCTGEKFFFGPRGFVEEGDVDRFLKQPLKFQNEVILLDVFTHDFTENGKQRTSYGLVLTSRRVFRNVLYAIDGQDTDGVFAAAGTYKLYYDNWTLVAFGSYSTRFTTQPGYSKNFVPWAYMFVLTEHESAYEYAYKRLFRSVVQFAKLLFKRDLVVKFASLDHSDCIANAYEAVWPGVLLLACYSHVSRKCRENKTKLADKTFFSTSVEVNIKQLHQARSSEQFEALSKLCLSFWRSSGQLEFADWFENVYLHQRWKRWFAVSAIPGILPSQNALESHNNVISTCGVAKKAKTGIVLNQSIPGILEAVAQDTPEATYGHCCEGPLMSIEISHAVRHVKSIGHFIKLGEESNGVVKRSIFFNAYMEISEKPEPITLERVNRYLSSKEGKLNAEDSVAEINQHYLSLYEVELLDVPERYDTFKLELQPIISIEKIQEIKTLYRCDCKSFWNTGWMCSHVIAAMTILNQFSLAAAIASN